MVTSEGSMFARGDVSIGGKLDAESGARLSADITFSRKSVAAGEVNMLQFV